ncbi:hypothetical protein AJ80_04902 [Polytolypa hystricis UAMH7299]|uniref:Ketoreductase (KR) domain-containing protein n=1 Tax=Polytolypa hystricis (strain UAMH7299) TaxID=1447883 RepID=A0A2B7Y7S5_POLH7|nr:hypothetical protein AJ80_04902 [Polytolypa hystricis UAMH7299]
MTEHLPPSGSGQSHFPTHDAPRVWILSGGDSMLGIALTRRLLAHGDYVLSGVTPSNPEREDPRTAAFEGFISELALVSPEWLERLRPRPLDIRMMSNCQSIVADAINYFGRVDILVCCSSQAIVGAVEELAASERTLMLIRDQFETNFFGPVNIMKACLPQMRKQKSGHIMVLSAITGHLGTPGLSAHCSATWALEGFCDSLAYEVAPFNIRTTILQATIEIGILTNLITSVPPILSAYSPNTNHAPLFRGILNGLLMRLPNLRPGGGGPGTTAAAGSYSPETTTSTVSPTASSTTTTTTIPSPERTRHTHHTHTHTHDSHDDSHASNLPLSAPTIVSLYPPLSPAHLEVLIAETIHALTSIGGHENPPARHIIGSEGVASVKEKLKTVSEELEDFIQCSCAVDISVEGVTPAAGGGGGSAFGSVGGMIRPASEEMAARAGF